MGTKLLYLIISLVLVFSCVKQKSTNPVPVIGYEDFRNAGKKSNGNDTATLVLSYEDGDGDLFLDDVANGPNLFVTAYYFNKSKNAWDAPLVQLDPTNPKLDTLVYSASIIQPNNGYYKGKSIKGDIYVPLNAFRPDDSQKIIKFRGSMVDGKGHFSNTFSSPTILLNF